MALIKETTYKEVIVKDNTSQRQTRYTVTTYEIGFYIRIDNRDKDNEDWYLEDVTTRNTPQKVTKFIESQIMAKRAEGYRVVLSTDLTVKKDPITFKYKI